MPTPEENKIKMMAAVMANAVLSANRLKLKSKQEPIVSKNKRNVLYKCLRGHIVKRKGKYKNSFDLDNIHYFCRTCGRLEPDQIEIIETGKR